MTDTYTEEVFRRFVQIDYMKPNEVFKDGYWVLHSEHCPGLNLAGTSLDAVLHDLPRAWAWLAEHNGSMPWPAAARGK